MPTILSNREQNLLSFRFSTTEGVLEVLQTYNELNDPDKPIPPEVTKVTGIRLAAHTIKFFTESAKIESLNNESLSPRNGR